ncbi:hypothetical protein [Polaribacter sp.]|uniref:hypothetical protein n=1 Tax=Polaribacter sp. TaxID=1920175 RepID=UPI003F6D9C05
MKKILFLLIAVSIFGSCSSSSDTTDVTFDSVIGNWKLISQKVNGVETADQCRQQTTFIFEDSRVLRQKFFRTENNTCIEGSEIISSWFNLGNSSYRINGASGSRLVIDLLFSDGNNKFTTSETDPNTNITTISVFQKF